MCQIWCCHGGEVSIRGLLGCDASEDGVSMDIRNVGILPQRYMTSQPTRPRIDCYLQ
jgi:hypothetical protein